MGNTAHAHVVSLFVVLGSQNLDALDTMKFALKDMFTMVFVVFDTNVSASIAHLSHLHDALVALSVKQFHISIEVFVANATVVQEFNAPQPKDHDVRETHVFKNLAIAIVILSALVIVVFASSVLPVMLFVVIQVISQHYKTIIIKDKLADAIIVYDSDALSQHDQDVKEDFN